MTYYHIILYLSQLYKAKCITSYLNYHNQHRNNEIKGFFGVEELIPSATQQTST